MSKHTQEDLENYFSYLDDLRESGATNMFGARPYLMTEFGLDKEAAADVLSLWMGSFDPEKTLEERARSAA